MKSRFILQGYAAIFALLLAVQATAGFFLLSHWRTQSLAEGAEAVRDISAYSASALDRTIGQTDALLRALPVLLKDQLQTGAVAPSAAQVLRTQIDQNEALRNVMVVDLDGFTLISGLPGSQSIDPAALLEARRGEQTSLMISAPLYDPTRFEWSILLSRRLELPHLGSVFGVAALSIPALSSQIAPATERKGVSLTVSGQDRTLFQSQIAPSEFVDAGQAARSDPDAAMLTATGGLSVAPLSLRVALSPKVALAEWRHDAAWILSLSGAICVLEIVAAAVAFAFIRSRAQARNEMERATQELLASRRRAQAAADARGIFIANMNHELRTPLNAVIGFSEILTNELFGPIGNPRYRDYAADIHASGAHLLSLINDIIDFSTIDLGHRKLEPAPIALPDALQEAMRLVRPQAAARSLRIEINGVQPDDWVLADSRALRQVFVNVLSNAIKFSPPEGMIRIVRDYPVGSSALEISIIDQGPGIPEAEIDKIGEQFFRTAAATESAVGGAGLGLSISMSLMNLMGGAIAVKSGSGKGTTMTLRLPKTSPQALEAAE